MAVCRIPKGKTKTYSEIAIEIGRPKAARAVGNALGKNPIPSIIPCHRVVGKVGMGGYSAKGGISRKRKLLKKEGALASNS